MTNDNPTPNSPPADSRRQLSDPKVVERILSDLARESIGCRVAVAKGIISDQDANTIEEKEIQHRVLPFLNRDKNYAAVPDWHIPGKIDSYLAKELQLDARGSENVIKAALAKFITELREAVNLAENPDISELQRKEKTKDIVARYRDALMGGAAPKPVPAPAPAVALPAPVAPVPAPVPASTPVAVPQKYLGDPQAIESIFTHLALESLRAEKAVAADQISASEATAIQDKEIEATLRIFLGADQRYAIDPNWNSAGVMDAFLAQELGLQERGVENIIKAALRKLMVDVRESVNAANGVSLPEAQWKPLVQKTVTSYRNLFLGLPVEAPLPTAEIAKTPEPAAAMPEWLTVEQAKAPAPVAKQTPVVPAPRPDESRELVGAVASEAPSRSGLGIIWKVALPLVLIIGIAIIFWARPRKEQKVEIAEVPKPVVVEEAPDAKIFMMRNGKIVTADGREIPSQQSADAEGGAGGESKFEFWYDMNIATGVAQFLVAKTRDASFQVKYGGPVAWDLWLTDENGKERLITKGAFRARFSPDGSMIAYTTTDCVLHVEDIEGKELAQTERAYEPNWNGDGSVLLFQYVPQDLTVYPPQATQLARFDLKAREVQIIVDGRYDDVIPHYHPSGNWILFVSGTLTGGRSFWKVPASGGQPMQLTNVRMNETEIQFVPTPYQTTLWSSDGKWFLFDFKVGTAEETWGLEFDDNGKFKRAVKLTEGLLPQWTGPSTFICQRRAGEGFEMVQQALPGS